MKQPPSYFKISLWIALIISVILIIVGALAIHEPIMTAVCSITTGVSFLLLAFNGFGYRKDKPFVDNDPRGHERARQRREYHRKMNNNYGYVG